MSTKLKSILFFGLLTLIAIDCRADKINVTGKVFDKASQTKLFGATAKLLNAADRSVVAEDKAEKRWMSGNTLFRETEFQLREADRNGRYILMLVRENYDTLYVDVDPSKASKRTDTMDLGKFFMKKRAKTLGEFTVQATKVKFYNRGDTLVYNADAFNLAEGSMLDALIRQLPGAELKEDGQIFVNGRFVENLMLNGKDFFKGDNRIMLENLGAYAVKEIKVYDRQDDMDRIMGKDYGKKTYSMDVRLKKEYSQGAMFNVEAGYGTRNRYLGRLFALWFSDHARVGVYGNANNLSNSGKPGENTRFNPAGLSSGNFNNVLAGLDYNAEMPSEGVNFSGNVQYDYMKIKSESHTYKSNFLSSGDTYDYRFNTGNTRNWTVSTSHSVKIEKENWNMQISPDFKYMHQNLDASNSAASFTKEQQNVSKDYIENIYSGASQDALALLLNRSLSLNSRKGYTGQGSMTFNGKWKTTQTDALSWLASGNYLSRRYGRNEDFALNFGSAPKPEQSDSRYFRDHPDHTYNIIGALGYVFAIRPGFFLDAYYQYERESSLTTSDLFRAENIYASLAEAGGAILPSMAEFERRFDPDNSYKSRFNSDLHSLNFNFNFTIRPINVIGNIRLPIAYRRQTLHYTRGEIDQRIRRNKVFLGDLSASVNWWKPSVGSLYLGVDRKVTSPDLVNMVDMTDALDPLNVMHGASNLKDAESLNARIYLSRSNNSNTLGQNYGLTYNVFRNALSVGYDYNTATGVRESRMYNVNGNWDLRATQSLTKYLGSMKRFSIGNSTALYYNRSVDMLGENNAGISRNVVNRYMVGESLNGGYSDSRYRVNVHVDFDWNRYTSRMSNFANFNAWNINYGVNGSVKFLKNFELATDFTIYTRRGYTDSALNTDNFVWNARLSYSAFRGQWLFMVDGFDILHNLKNISQTVNAQGRTETWSNVLPRYVMFHIQWKFSKLPKKK